MINRHCITARTDLVMRGGGIGSCAAEPAQFDATAGWQRHELAFRARENAVGLYDVETWDTIRARRNVRQYTGQPIAREDLERIVEAGRRAPSSGNWQPWNFVVVTVREQLIELAKVWDRGGRHIAQSAATIALVAREPEDEVHRDWLMYDFGQATANMMLAAADIGIGSGHSAVLDQQQAQRVLGLPDGYMAVYLIGLGYPADRPLRPLVKPNRRPFDEVVHWNRW
jgi:nitroreductase